jgi:OOP family OmpA-OmpF porin
MLRVISLATAAVLFSASALAADNGVYLGAGVSQAKVDFEAGASRFDGDDTKFKVIAGVRPLDWLAVEVNYVDFGTVEERVGANSFEYRLKGIDAFLVGLLEIQVVDFYLKAGAVRFDQELRLNNADVNLEDDTGYEPAYGGGIQAHIGSLSVRAEYEKFEISDVTDVDLISLGVTWTFL